MSASVSAPAEEFSRRRVMQALRHADPRELGLDATSAHVLEKLLVHADPKGERFDVVAQIASELQARRLASAGAIDFASERARRERTK